MRLGYLMRELLQLVSPPALPAVLAPARVNSQPAKDWVARNRCW